MCGWMPKMETYKARHDRIAIAFVNFKILTHSHSTKQKSDKANEAGKDERK